MSRGVRKEGLSRRHRFTARDSFRLLIKGPRKLRGQLAVLHVACGREGLSRFGISVPKRAAKSSVERNRIKRLARELFRKHAAKQAGIDVVVTLTNRFDRSQARALGMELSALLDQSPAKAGR
jgi:ribonuclease P protein component